MEKKLLWTYAGVTSATGGTVTKDFDVYGISIDSRSVEKGDLFVALKAERDGHFFIKNAMQRGASGALAVWKPKNLPADFPVIYVKNTLQGLRALAGASRTRSRAKIIAITGSAGKTTVKEIFKHILPKAGLTHAAEKSFNNHWGVPLTLARMPAETAYGVFEVGMNRPGEIGTLSELVRPHVAIITSIGPAHIGNFNDISEIALEKSDIFKGLLPEGTAIINADHDYFELICEKARERGIKIISFGKNPNADVRLTEYEAVNSDGGATANYSIFGQSVSLKLKLLGEHNAVNVAGVLATLPQIGLSIADVGDALSEFTAPVGRGEVVVLSLPQGAEIIITDESYNANPLSMRAALNNFQSQNDKISGRRIAVIGEMRELGSKSAEAHAGVADAVSAANFDKIYLIGEACEALYDALGEESPCIHALHLDDVSDEILLEVQAGDRLFIKGSNAMKLAKLVAALKARHIKIDADTNSEELFLDENDKPEEPSSENSESNSEIEEDSLEQETPRDAKKAV